MYCGSVLTGPSSAMVWPNLAFRSTLAGGYNGYIPSARAFERAGGYETKFLTSSFLAPEAAKMVTDACAELLRTM